jgi:hypothetical protein
MRPESAPLSGRLQDLKRSYRNGSDMAKRLAVKEILVDHRPGGPYGTPVSTAQAGLCR